MDTLRFFYAGSVPHVTSVLRGLACPIGGGGIHFDFASQSDGSDFACPCCGIDTFGLGISLVRVVCRLADVDDSTDLHRLAGCLTNTGNVLAPRDILVAQPIDSAGSRVCYDISNNDRLADCTRLFGALCFVATD